MKKLILVRPNYNSHIITPPLGIGFLASYLKKEGVDVKLIDGLKDNLSNEKILEIILKENPDAVGITCLSAFYNEVIELSHMVKKENFSCFIGGVHPTFLPYKTLVDSKADYVVCGEGEIALTKLFKNNFKNKGIKGIYSLADLKDENQPFEKCEIIENLDDCPFPDWEQIDPNTYPKAPHGAIAKNFPIGIVTTTRGCPYECTFCASPHFYSRKIRYRSPENVIEEIKLLTEKYKVKEIHFEDDNLTLNREHIEKICNLIIKNKIKISWACPNGIRADKVDEDLIKLMAKSGCYCFAYGIESANTQILNNIKKHETIDVIEKSIRIADKCGISCHGFFIFGLPGETKETIEESINFAIKSKLSRAQFLILDVLPGCELWTTLQGEFIPNFAKNSYKEPEWLPVGLTKKCLLEAQSKAFKKFYLRPVIFLKMLKSVRPAQFKFLFKRLTEYRLIENKK
ncbi:MAG: radical SAM protein [Candidatus Gastranaerophilales bacterium]|nr:radical SAM protein [Candidatus Gastranaerophilales bacterium]